MSNRIIEVGLEKTIATEKTETQKKNTDGADRKREKIEKGYGCMGKNSERKYKAVSRNGDTLELSQAGSRLGDKGDAGASPGKKVIAESNGQISEAVLSGYSRSKLRQLYADKQITRQQYERVLKKKGKMR